MKLVGLAPWPYLAAQSGGTERTLRLFEAVGDITTLSLDWNGAEAREQHGAIDYRVVAASPTAREKAGRLIRNGVSTFDPMPMLVKNDLTEFRDAIASLEPDVVVMEHPWLIDYVPATARLVYDAANCETVNTQQQHPRSFDVDLVADLERRTIERADLITYASEDDARALRRLFNPTAPMIHIPNGTDLPPQTSDGSTRNLLFIGSVYPPNVTAAQLLTNHATLMPDYHVHIVGGCSQYITNPADNVTLHGHVTDEQREALFSTAHAFVTLTTHGSGSHLKIARALAHGLPVITTPLGARGYDSRGIILTTIGDLPDRMREVTDNWAHHSQLAREQGAELSWPAIQAKFGNAVEGVKP